MSHADNQQNTRVFRERSTLESILPKKGKLPVSLAQLANLRLKQLPPEGTQVVLVLEGNGNVRCGITDQMIQMSAIGDLQKMNASRTMAHRILGVQKKQEMETVLASTVLSTVGPVPITVLDPTPGCVQELRRAHVEIERVQSNAADINKLPAVDPLRKRVKAYLLATCAKLESSLKTHIATQLSRGAAKKEEVNMHSLLLTSGVPRVLYNKLVQANVVESMQTDVYNIMFGSKISKSLKLSYEEINSSVMDPELSYFLEFRNTFTLTAARSADIFEYVKTGLDEADLRRLARIQLTMVGPGNISREWKAPQPMAPIPYDAVGELLLKINQNEVNFHSGVIPVGVRPHEFWSGQVTAEKAYLSTDSGKEILNQASEDGQNVQPTENGFYLFNRDRDRAKQREMILVGKLGKFLPEKKPPAPKGGGDGKVDEKVAVSFDNPKYLGVKFEGLNPVDNPRHYLADGVGQTWFTEFVKKIFLRSASDLANKKKKAGGGVTNRKLPDQVFQGILRLKIDKELKSELGKFLMQFASVVLMQRAFDLFEAELQKMELDGSWIAPGVSLFDDEQDEQSAFFE